MRHKQPKGVIVFSVLLIASSLFHMSTLIFSRAWYWHNFAYLPSDILIMRYLFSWAQRILGLMAGFGIMQLKNAYRRLALVLAFFTISALYWKHPYRAFLNHAERLDELLGFLFKQAGHPEISFASLAVPGLIAHYALDIIFFGSLIYYFTRPEVKKHFH